MPLTTFVDEKVIEVIEELSKINEDIEESIFPEHDFYLACIKLGLRLEDLKYLSYIDVLKIFICLNKQKPKNKKERKATQTDIDRLLA